MSAEALTIEGEFYEARYANGLWAVAMKGTGDDRSLYLTKPVAELALVMRDQIARHFLTTERNRLAAELEAVIEERGLWVEGGLTAAVTEIARRLRTEGKETP